MFTEQDLLTLSNKPKITDVSLQLYADFYENHLCNKIFEYELENKTHQKVNLQFGKGDMCHLLGIHHIFKGVKNKKEYAGESGFQKIKNGTVTFDFLKQKNNPIFKSKQNRILYFPFIHQVLMSSTVLLFRNDGLTKIDADLMFYNQQNGIFFHLGIVKDNTGNFYSPITFYDRNNNNHIANQEVIPVTSKSVIDTSSFSSRPQNTVF